MQSITSNCHQVNVEYIHLKTGQNLYDLGFYMDRSLSVTAKAAAWRPYRCKFGEGKYSALGNLLALLYRH